MSGILKYFHVVKKESSSTPNGETNLPDPSGPLSKVIPSSVIAKVNEKVSSVIEKPAAASREPYFHVTAAQRYQIGKRAAEFGVTNALRYYAKNFPGLRLKETSVRRFKNLYQCGLKDKKWDDSSNDVRELPNKKMGWRRSRLTTSGICTLSSRLWSPVNTSVVIATAEGILTSIDANVLASNGGGISLSKDWAKSLLIQMGMVK